MSRDLPEVRVGNERREGRVIDLRDRDVSARTVAAAVRNGSTASDRSTNDGPADDHPTNDDSADDGIEVTRPTPRAVHEDVGYIHGEMTIAVRTALAAAARSRGLTAPQDEDVAALRERLADLDVPETPDLAAAHERLAGTETAVERLRERVATLRGRIQAGREAGRDVADAEADLREATRKLSERETERAAARETLDRARRVAREARDGRERRRQLEDRLANRERDARAHLVATVRDEFAAAVRAVPQTGETDAKSRPDPDADPFDVGDVTAALAVARVADLRAPVVLAVDRFAGTEAAADWLDAPVVRVPTGQKVQTRGEPKTGQ